MDFINQVQTWKKTFQVICGLHPAGKRISKVFYSLQEGLEDVLQPIGGPEELCFLRQASCSVNSCLLPDAEDYGSTIIMDSILNHLSIY